MNALILYATKHGATFGIAQRIADNIGGATLHDLKQGNAPDLAGFDCVIIGSSLYAGAVRKEAKVFLVKNADSLQGKTIGLFLSGLQFDEEQKAIEANFSPTLLQTANVVSFLGGIFDPQKAGVMERFIMKVVTKQTEYTNTIDNEKVKQFAALIKPSQGG
ncbi:MAG: flavodoxin domain-containing protein [Oscillospiraceae bacterium]|nr:flavodoxin domain-containing protein [Oscillospiraceae bacterium]